MKNYLEFAQLVKAKYPEYAEVDDLKLAKAMVSKYPEYKSQVSFEGTGDALRQKAKEDYASDVEKARLESVAEIKANNPLLSKIFPYTVANQGQSKLDPVKDLFSVPGRAIVGNVEGLASGITSMVDNDPNTKFLQSYADVADENMENTGANPNTNAVTGFAESMVKDPYNIPIGIATAGMAPLAGQLASKVVKPMSRLGRVITEGFTKAGQAGIVNPKLASGIASVGKTINAGSKAINVIPKTVTALERLAEKSPKLSKLFNTGLAGAGINTGIQALERGFNPNEEVNAFDPSQIAKDATIGGLVGSGFGGIGMAGTALAERGYNKIAEHLVANVPKRIQADIIAKWASDKTAKNADQITSAVNNIAKYIKDSPMSTNKVKFLDNIAEYVESGKNDAGKAIGNIYDDLDRAYDEVKDNLATQYGDARLAPTGTGLPSIKPYVVAHEVRNEHVKNNPVNAENIDRFIESQIKPRLQYKVFGMEKDNPTNPTIDRTTIMPDNTGIFANPNLNESSGYVKPSEVRNMRNKIYAYLKDSQDPNRSETETFVNQLYGRYSDDLNKIFTDRLDPTLTKEALGMKPDEVYGSINKEYSKLAGLSEGIENSKDFNSVLKRNNPLVDEAGNTNVILGISNPKAYAATLAKGMISDPVRQVQIGKTVANQPALNIAAFNVRNMTEGDYRNVQQILNKKEKDRTPQEKAYLAARANK